MTDKIYERDSYVKQFSATVVSCEKKDSFYYTVLDKTAFFAEGGGQGADRGEINGVRVLDVQEKDGEVFHKTETPFEEGEEVVGTLDWHTRFDRMQNHTAEHITAGVIHSLFGYNNVGFHLSDEIMTADFDGPLSEADVEKIELLANRAVFENHPISVSFPTTEEFSRIECRSKLELGEGIRVVKIEGVDTCACCAPHTAMTGEVGVIKILDFSAYKGGVRLEMAAGERAYLDYARFNAQNKRLMAVFSAKRGEVEEAVMKLCEDTGALRAEVHALSGKLALATLSPIEIKGVTVAFLENCTYDDLRLCANSLVSQGSSTVFLFSKTPDGSLYVASSPEGDVREAVKGLNLALGGKGGGKPSWAQGKVSQTDSEKIKEVLTALV